jgi:NADPH:quinone reductase-like Zn-dependent oxidoreductase
VKALFYTRYGPPEVLQLKEMEKPLPQDNELLIRVHATTVNRTDNATIKALPFFARVVTGLLRPRRQIPGTEFSGVVEATGSSVVSLRVGDRVFGFTDLLGGCHAEYLITTEANAVTIPKGISFEQAAASSEGAHYAYNFINKLVLERGEDVLVNGASGAIGSAAVQLLRHFGLNITAVCGPKSIEQVKKLGATRVIDYTQQDFTRQTQQYHYVFDTVGKSSFFKCRRLLLPGGVYISSDLGYLAQNIFLPLITPLLKPLLGGRKSVTPYPSDIHGSLVLIRKLLAEGEFAPLIDRRYPLAQIVEAYRYVEQGHKKGNVVITVTAPQHG